MLGVDTNILVRFFTRDEKRQFEQASRLVGSAGDGELFIGPVVLVELTWILRSAYRYERTVILDLLDDLLEFREFTIGDRELVQRALDDVRTHGGDFADALIALLNGRDGCMHTVTFDKKAARLDSVRPIEDALR